MRITDIITLHEKLGVIVEEHNQKIKEFKKKHKVETDGTRLKMSAANLNVVYEWKDLWAKEIDITDIKYLFRNDVVAPNQSCGTGIVIKKDNE